MVHVRRKVRRRTGAIIAGIAEVVHHLGAVGACGDSRARGTPEAERDGEDSERRAQDDRARIPNRGVHRSPPVRGQPKTARSVLFPEDRAAVETDDGWSLRSASEAPQMAGKPANSIRVN